MQAWRTLGLVAHRGGRLIMDPLLNVGVVIAVSRASGLQLELVARRPFDDRSATRRQSDIRGGAGVTPAPRVLLPPHDEGTDLRLGWFDAAAGQVRWTHPAAYERSSGRGADSVDQLTYLLPPLFERVDLALAWPEIGFAERTVPLTLPSRADVVQASVSVWDADVDAPRAPAWTAKSTVPHRQEPLRPEDGLTVAGPRVLWRSPEALVVLTRLARHEQAWQVELIGYARDTRADIAGAAAKMARDAFAGGRGTMSGGGLVAGIVDGDTVRWDLYPAGQTTGAPGDFETTRLSTLPLREDDTDVVRLAARWPAAGLSDTEFAITTSH